MSVKVLYIQTVLYKISILKFRKFSICSHIKLYLALPYFFSVKNGFFKYFKQKKRDSFAKSGTYKKIIRIYHLIYCLSNF